MSATFTDDLKARNIAASIRDYEYRLKMLESKISDASNTILIMRKRRALLRVQLRRQIRQLQKQEARLG